MLIAHEYKKVRWLSHTGEIHAGLKLTIPPTPSIDRPTDRQYVKRNMTMLEEPLKAVTRPLDQMFTLRELDENVRCVCVRDGSIL